MTTHPSFRAALAASLMLSWLLVAAPVGAQQPTDEPPATTPAPEAPAALSEAPQPEAPAPAPSEGRAVVRMGQSYVLAAGERVREVVVMSGSATIDGEVERDLVVIVGTVTLGNAARVGQDMVVIGGAVTVEPGAQVDGDFVVVGGAVDAPDTFRPGREHVVIGPPVGGQVRSVLPWVTRGLLWGRPIVPSLPWIWALIAIALLMAILVLAVFTQPVRVTARVLAEKPLSAALVGLLVVMLTGPVAVLLAITVVGIPLIPLAFCALFIALVLGKVAVVVWLGDRVMPPAPDAAAGVAFRSLLIGSALIVVAYMVPILGAVVWALVGLLALGAATLALVGALQRERPRRQPPVPPSPGPGVTPGPSAPGTAAGIGAESDTSVAVVSPMDPLAAAPAASLPPPAAPAVAASAAALLAFPRAGLLIRLAAVALDVLLVAIADGLMDLTERGGAFLILLLAYHIIFWIWKGTTVGGIICHLRLVRVDGAPLRPGDAVVRGLSGIFSVIVVGLGFLWILKDPEGQAWHDKIAGTYVVTVPGNWPL